ncbi:TIGR02556 family CRISPR-associated protein [Tunicatimonas pelagia]|uniref:TIGR02556 family CRISPR-associated protein n=1 Tax=Tunicatimonas pelagia TaxID=931531 RepID=UPI00266632D9|nr:TIGR02556 family CRISPR-associated protein [Tunicatimonas pelagia]WKN44271.1 TIGR02556 family CRISPR-associated protein [Tunicatimonas pelagia]
MQDRAITAIGKLTLDQSSLTDPYQVFVQDMFPGQNYSMLLLVFACTESEDNISIIFEGTDMEVVSEKNFDRYAYRKGSARGGDITFTTKLSSVPKKFKTFAKQQLKAIPDVAKSLNLQKEYEIFNSLQGYVKEHYEELESKLIEEHGALDKKAQQSCGFSLKIVVDGEIRYLSDFKTIRYQILTNGTEGKSNKYSVISEGKNQLCSICLEKKEKIHGFASPFKYATVDKTGMVSGFFNQKTNWKNYPICSDCALIFEVGSNYVQQNLKKYFYGKSYYAIPKSVINQDIESLQKALKRIESVGYQLKEGHVIKQSEEYLMRTIAKEDNHFTLNLLFFEENPTTKAIKIKLMLEEILPSRFNKLFVQVPDKINISPLYKNALVVKKEKVNLTFSFGVLKTFFAEDFYEIVNTVFLGLPLSKEVLYTKFMRVIRQNYNKMHSSDGFVENTYRSLLKAHISLAYLLELDIINYNQNDINMDIIEISENKSRFDSDKFKQFVEKNKSFLDEEYKIGVFAVGILVRFLLDIQNASLGNTPFEKKLKGYHLNPALLRNIYIEALNKIALYQKNFYAYSNLRDVINQFFTVEYQHLSKISNNELSFYFVAGLEFGRKFKTEKVTEDQPE